MMGKDGQLWKKFIIYSVTGKNSSISIKMKHDEDDPFSLGGVKSQSNEIIASTNTTNILTQLSKNEAITLSYID